VGIGPGLGSLAEPEHGIKEIGNIGVVAHHNKNRGRQAFIPGLLVLFPKPIVFLIVAVETMKGALRAGQTK